MKLLDLNGKSATDCIVKISHSERNEKEWTHFVYWNDEACQVVERNKFWRISHKVDDLIKGEQTYLCRNVAQLSCEPQDAKTSRRSDLEFEVFFEFKYCGACRCPGHGSSAPPRYATDAVEIHLSSETKLSDQDDVLIVSTL
ncbi:hypothetical protein TNCV_3424741 [Trichonephila clavipes]|nr:hypothetical protein TNCV_3424741 [Trichonephila clavipes]